MTNYLKLCFLAGAALLGAISIDTQAQVVIGSVGNPNPGSLLDLKETDAQGTNSTKGFALPRVKLKSIKVLPPENATFSGDQVHTGLVVYNLTDKIKESLCPGMYLWNGSNWVFMQKRRCECEYTIKGNDSNEYYLYCEDFTADQAQAELKCKNDTQNAKGRTYHLMTDAEFSNIWNKPTLEDNTNKFADGSYYISHRGWTTMATINSGKTSLLALGFAFPGGTPIGGRITGDKIARCVRN